MLMYRLSHANDGLVCLEVKPFKAYWQLLVPAVLTVSNAAFCMVLTVNSD
jgi:hypothetical protein